MPPGAATRPRRRAPRPLLWAWLGCCAQLPYRAAALAAARGGEDPLGASRPPRRRAPRPRRHGGPDARRGEGEDAANATSAAGVGAEMEQEPRQRFNPRTVHVAYATTPDGFPGLLHSLNSLARNVPSEESLSVHVVVPQEHVGRANAVLGCFSEEVKDLPPRDLRVQVYPMKKLGFDTSPMLNTTRGWMRSWGNLRLSRPTVFARFYLHEMLPREVERVLWLDVDTIVKGDVGPLYRMRMTRPVAARMPGSNRTVGAAFPRWSCVQHLDPATSFAYFSEPQHGRYGHEHVLVPSRGLHSAAGKGRLPVHHERPTVHEHRLHGPRRRFLQPHLQRDVHGQPWCQEAALARGRGDPALAGTGKAVGAAREVRPERHLAGHPLSVARSLHHGPIWSLILGLDLQKSLFGPPQRPEGFRRPRGASKAVGCAVAIFRGLVVDRGAASSIRTPHSASE
ncbi:unnamed protein product [Prorocentrum cordatum]|uniref:Hexosyltransferase n=1 Tax=Prorocentrum cordatum TaxID=2364126 RepID=A0ABN9R7P5_9DINO|nr:unnamed protein product [Polarella glacialis]